MKKLISKLLLTVLTLTLMIAQASPANADLAGDATTALDNLVKKSCIEEVKLDGSAGKDEGYLITIMEEPLYLKDSDEKTPTSDFEARICYRNTFSYIRPDTKAENTLSELATECSEEFEQLYQKNKDTNRKALFTCQPVQVILCKGGTCLINHYISMLYKFGATLGGIIAVLVLVINAVIIAMAGGDSGGIEEAKKRIIQSLAGLAVLFLSALILYTINPTFFIR